MQHQASVPTVIIECQHHIKRYSLFLGSRAHSGSKPVHGSTVPPFKISWGDLGNSWFLLGFPLFRSKISFPSSIYPAEILEIHDFYWFSNCFGSKISLGDLVFVDFFTLSTVLQAPPISKWLAHFSIWKHMKTYENIWKAYCLHICIFAYFAYECIGKHRKA